MVTTGVENERWTCYHSGMENGQRTCCNSGVENERWICYLNTVPVSITVRVRVRASAVRVWHRSFAVPTSSFSVTASI